MHRRCRSLLRVMTVSPFEGIPKANTRHAFAEQLSARHPAMCERENDGGVSSLSSATHSSAVSMPLQGRETALLGRPSTVDIGVTLVFWCRLSSLTIARTATTKQLDSRHVHVLYVPHSPTVSLPPFPIPNLPHRPPLLPTPVHPSPTDHYGPMTTPLVYKRAASPYFISENA